MSPLFLVWPRGQLIYASSPFIGHKGDPNRYHQRPGLHLPRLSERRRPCVIRHWKPCRPATPPQRLIYHALRSDLHVDVHAIVHTSQFTRMERLHHYRRGGTLVHSSCLLRSKRVTPFVILSYRYSCSLITAFFCCPPVSRSLLILAGHDVLSLPLSSTLSRMCFGAAPHS